MDTPSYLMIREAYQLMEEYAPVLHSLSKESCNFLLDETNPSKISELEQEEGK